ncbi:unnamed protein product [Peniophora sp. CBMAI 1063]|nr:unnamed protein product [Peniophora sp. CBMAI 1063]
MQRKELASAEEAAVRLRINEILRRLGPDFFSHRPKKPGLAEKIADGMRFEAALHAAVSGALAIRGVPPMAFHTSVAGPLQDAVYNTTAGSYDILEAEYLETQGPGGRWGIPTSSVAPRSIDDVPAFIHLLGLDLDTKAWWESEEPASLEGEAAQAAFAARLMMTTERFGFAPPIRAHGSNGSTFVLAPDIVNTVEHIDAQMQQLRGKLEEQRSALRRVTEQCEDRFLAAYHYLYEGAAAASPEIGMIERYFRERGGDNTVLGDLDLWVAEWFRRGRPSTQ